MKALWNGHLLAESDDTVIVNKNHYFPMSSVRHEYFVSSNTTTRCLWKGKACYYSVVVDGKENKDAAWCYSAPMCGANKIKGMIAFWHGVEITE